MLPDRPQSLAHADHFDRFFSDSLAASLQDAEKLNKKASKTFRFFMVAALLTVPFPIMAFLEIGNDDINVPLFIVGLVISAILFLIGAYQRSTYISEVKDLLLGPILAHYGDLKFHPSASDFKGAMKDHLETILPPHDRLHMDDAVSGTYRGLRIFVTDVTAEEVRRRDKNTEVKEVFSGLVVIVSEASKRSGDYWLKPQRLGWNIGNRVSAWFSDLERIKLESPDFERAYDFFGSDQVEGRVLMTPALMERWTALEDLSSDDGVCANFSPDCLRLRFGLDHDWLDDSILENAEEGRAAVQALIAEFEAVFDVIDLAFESHQ